MKYREAEISGKKEERDRQGAMEEGSNEDVQRLLKSRRGGTEHKGLTDEDEEKSSNKYT